MILKGNNQRYYKKLFLEWILWSSKFNLHHMSWMPFKKKDGFAPPRLCIILKTYETVPSVATGLRIAENSKNWPNFKNTWVIEANVSKLIGLTILKVCIKNIYRYHCSWVFISFHLLFIWVVNNTHVCNSIIALSYEHCWISIILSFRYFLYNI